MMLSKRKCQVSCTYYGVYDARKFELVPSGSHRALIFRMGSQPWQEYKSVPYSVGDRVRVRSSVRSVRSSGDSTFGRAALSGPWPREGGLTAEVCQALGRATESSRARRRASSPPLPRLARETLRR